MSAIHSNSKIVANLLISPGNKDDKDIYNPLQNKKKKLLIPYYKNLTDFDILFDWRRITQSKCGK
jgi:hypothetical protein